MRIHLVYERQHDPPYVVAKHRDQRDRSMHCQRAIL